MKTSNTSNGICVLWVGLGQTKLIAQCPTSASVVAVASGDVCLGATVYYYAEVTGDWDHLLILGVPIIVQGTRNMF